MKRTIPALGIAATITLAGCAGQDAGSPDASTTSSVGVGHAAHPPVQACRATRLEPRVVDAGSVMSQPFVTIALRNDGPGVCRLRGYPDVVAYGQPDGAGPSRRLGIRVRNGSIYERPDRGPRNVVLLPHEAAVFSVGTATAYDGGAHLITVTRLGITPPGDTVSLSLRVDLAASHPRGKPIPVGVTAVQSAIR